MWDTMEHHLLPEAFKLTGNWSFHSDSVTRKLPWTPTCAVTAQFRLQSLASEAPPSPALPTAPLRPHHALHSVVLPPQQPAFHVCCSSSLGDRLLFLLPQTDPS